jgi:hypothetical protein
MAQHFPYGFASAMVVGIASSGAQVTLAGPENLWIWQIVTAISFALALLLGARGGWLWWSDCRIQKVASRGVAGPPVMDPHIARVAPELLEIFGALQAAATVRRRQSNDDLANIRTLTNRANAIHTVLDDDKRREDSRASRAKISEIWDELYDLLTKGTAVNPLPTGAAQKPLL